MLLGIFLSFLDRGWDHVGLAIPDADSSLTVADDDESAEAEATATLDRGCGTEDAHCRGLE